ncbi:MAG: SMP-30/gluconolactonase/LRE family protein, partial [Haliea sp.]
MIARLLVVAAAVGLGYLLWWPVPVAPVAWNAPENPGYRGDFLPNTALAGVERLDIAATHGPEALALGPDGLLYTSSHEGWIVRYDPVADNSERWVNTGGRPLGLAFDGEGTLLVADAYLGLLGIAPGGELTVLSDRVNGAPIRYADDVDVAPDGRVYFSDASSKFGARAWGGTYEASLLDMMEHGGHGRLLVYDPADGSTDVVLDGLQFANGVAVSADGSFVLVNETASYRITRLWLAGERAG